MTEYEKLVADAERYRWLRDNPRKAYYKSRPMDAPYVIDPNRSRLYAVVSYTGADLDKAIDMDRINDMAQHIYEQTFVEGDVRFSDPNFQFSDEFSDECMVKAEKILGIKYV